MASPPTPRDLLTSIIASISAIPLPPSDQANLHTTKSQPDNPLKLIPVSARPLFTTLHVLFPSMLLPALDLLDRSLVTKATLPHSVSDDSTGATSSAPSSIYLVRSAQQPRRHWKSGDGAGGEAAERPGYVVHIEAWSCTCAAFAFSAFPPAALGRLGACDAGKVETGLSVVEALLSMRSEEGGGGLEGAWEFGGMSSDGKHGRGSDQDSDESDKGKRVDAGGVSCCKHLLACVLAEGWADGLGRYVNERTAKREEMAGLIADV